MKSFSPFIIIGICAGMYFVYISPAISDVMTKRARYAEYQAVLNKVQEIKTRKDDLSAKYSSIPTEELDRLLKIIPENFDPVLFANDLNGMASKYGMRLQSLKIDSEPVDRRIVEDTVVADKSYRNIPVTFDVSGRFDQIVSLLKDIESSLRLIDVVSITIRSGGGENNRDVALDYGIEIVTYSLK